MANLTDSQLRHFIELPAARAKVVYDPESIIKQVISISHPDALQAEAYVRAHFLLDKETAITAIEQVADAFDPIIRNRHRAFIRRYCYGNGDEIRFLRPLCDEHPDVLRYADWLANALCREGMFDEALKQVDRFYSTKRRKPKPVIDWYLHWQWRATHPGIFLQAIGKEAVNYADWQEIASHYRAATVRSFDSKIYCINLPEDTKRLLYIERMWGNSGAITRVEGVKGSILPEYLKSFAVPERTTQSASIIGCALSHISTWERVAVGSFPLALVIEDDAFPLFPLTSDIESLMTTLDVFFVNRHACPKLGTQKFRFGEVVSLNQIDRPCGTYGYVVSREGAKNMLEKISATRIDRAIDAWMVGQVRSGAVKGMVAALPSVEHCDFGLSVRNLYM